MAMSRRGFYTNEITYAKLPDDIVIADRQLQNKDPILTTRQRDIYFQEYKDHYLSGASKNVKLDLAQSHIPLYSDNLHQKYRKMRTKITSRVQDKDIPGAIEKVCIKRKHAKNKVHKLTSRERRTLFDLGAGQKSHGLKFTDMIDLHRVWLGYIQKKISNCLHTDLELTMCCADYHGALFVVSKSKNPTLIGKRGIVVQEMRNAFRILCEDNRLLTIGKNGSAFSITLEDKLYTIYGSRIVYAPAERASRKYVRKPFINL